MVMMMKLDYVYERPNGSKRFRRRFPKKVAAFLEDEWFQKPITAREGSALVVEQEALLSEYESIVA